MASFYSRIHNAVLDLVYHPPTTVIGLLAGLTATTAFLGQLDQNVSEFAARHLISSRSAAATHQAIFQVGAVQSLCLLLASTGRSLITEPSVVLPPRPDNSSKQLGNRAESSTTMASINLAQIALLPHLQGLLGVAVNAIGGGSITDLYSRVDALVKGDVFDVGNLDGILTDVQSLLAKAESLFGQPAPGSVFAQIADEVNKYQSLLSGVLSGQPQVLMSQDVSTPNGQQLIAVTTLQMKPSA